jgi:hypothetical protein
MMEVGWRWRSGGAPVPQEEQDDRAARIADDQVLLDALTEALMKPDWSR